MKFRIIPDDVPVLYEGGVAAYLPNGGPARLCHVIHIPGACREARVQFWDDDYPRWVDRRWLSPHLTPREQKIAQSRLAVSAC